MFRKVVFFILFCSGISFSQKVTARFYYPVADSIAQSILDDELNFYKVRNDSVDLSGKAETWIYAYQGLDISNSTDSVDIGVKISINADSVVIDTTLGHWTGSSSIRPGWLDSDSAIIIAEQNGGAQFRQLHPDCRIILDLGRSSGSPFTEWWVEYISKTASNAKIIIRIDALIGELLYTDVKQSTNEKNILHYSLYQNYPNPFNSCTTLHYDLDKVAHVKLVVYNIAGRVIKVIANDLKNSGSYQTVWDGRDDNGKSVPSGIYFAKLSTNDQMWDVKKMVLIK